MNIKNIIREENNYYADIPCQQKKIFVADKTVHFT